MVIFLSFYAASFGGVLRGLADVNITARNFLTAGFLFFTGSGGWPFRIGSGYRF